MHYRRTILLRLSFVVLVVLFIQLSLSISPVLSQDITIGKQTWTSKNLNVNTFRNGEPIKYAKNKYEWISFGEKKEPAYCYKDFDPQNVEKFGVMYNLHAIYDERNLAPLGYHIPSSEEWQTLIDYVGGKDVAGRQLKSTTAWISETTCDNCKGWSEEQRSGKKECPSCKSWSKEYRSKKACDVCFDTRKLEGKKKNCIVCKDTRLVDSYSYCGVNAHNFNVLPAGNYDADGVWWGGASFGTSTLIPGYGVSGEWVAGKSIQINMYHAFNYAEESYTSTKLFSYSASIRCIKNQPTKGELFLAETKKQPGIITTNSGLQYKIMNQTTGPKPSANSTVKVNYTGKLLDGKVFDSSKEDGAREFQLTNVIKGMVEGIQLMSKGSKYVFIIPANLAYGENGAVDVIGPNEVLLFEVELVDFKD